MIRLKASGSYRCHLRRNLLIAESGVLEFIQVKATDAESAARAALKVSGAIAVVEVERIEPVRVRA